MIHCIEKGIGWGLIQDGFLFSQVLTLICKLKRVGAMHFKSVFGRSLFLLLSFALIPAAYSGEGEDVLVIFNSRSPESRLVAEHYLRKRAVPSAQMKGFDLPLAGALSREDYTRGLQDPLMSWMTAQGLATWTHETVRASKGIPAGKKHTLKQSRIRYLLLCYGVPWYIQNDPGFREDTNGVPDFIRRNDASVDDDLALLPRLGHSKFVGVTQNPFAGTTNASMIQAQNGAFVVTRLDGPTPQIAMGLVDKAMEAESKGLWGHAYIDLRNITNSAYAAGDEMLTNVASASKRLGFETFIDNQPETFRLGYPMSQIGIYAGWYESGITGPFVRPTMEFMPGAFGYHLHSFSAANIRSADENWVGPLLARGVTCTLGCVAEPYLALTPHPGIFLERWGYLGMTFGEASMACRPALSWQTVAIGDPLYRPFRLNPIQYGEMLSMANNPLSAYALVRKANVDKLLGRPVEPLLEILEKNPMATNNSVLAEKIARMYWSQARVTKSEEWYAIALAARGCTPRQRIRLLLDSVETHRVLGHPKAALDALEEVIQAEPDRVDALALRNRQLNFAVEMADSLRAEKVRVEIRKLTPTNPPTK